MTQNLNSGFPKETHILVADDAEESRMMNTLILKKAGFYQIDTAADGHEAMSKIAAASFGLILSDDKMPGMNGLEILEEIRRVNRTLELPFVLISGIGRTPPEQIGSDPFAGFLAKPYQVQEFLSALANFYEQISNVLAQKSVI